MGKSWKKSHLRKIIAPDKVEAYLEKERKLGKTVASLNGSFDLLHAGHLQIIYEASQQADLLIIALNSDESVQSYKGPLRPIVPLKQRLEMLAALEFVDLVTWFEEKDPREILKKIKPHVHVNGAEYGQKCIEAEVVKSLKSRLHLCKRIPALSTSALIEKVKKCD